MLKQDSKIIVTGGAGYIGSHTLIELIQAGYSNAVSIDDYSNSTEETYDRIRQITGHDVVHEQADLSDRVAAASVLAKHSDARGLIHFAAHKSVPESVAHPLSYYNNNINSLHHVLDFALKSPLSRVVFSSSCSIYGNIDSLPVHEETPAGKAESPYAFTKVVGERMMQDCCAVNPAFTGVSLRYFNPVGAHSSGLIGEWPRNRPNNLVPVITRTAIGKIDQMEVFGNDYPTRDGTCIRDYVHVSDIARAHVSALFRLEMTSRNYDVINLGTGKGVSVLEAIEAFERVTGVRVKYRISPRRAGDVSSIYSDCTKAKSVLDWEALYSLDEMMRSAWAWEENLRLS